MEFRRKIVLCSTLDCRKHIGVALFSYIRITALLVKA